MGASTVMRNHRGDLVEAPTFSASEAKNAFGRILDAVARSGLVTITRHDEPKAVLLSMDEYRDLVASRASALDTLAGEFDAMLMRMQAEGARRALQAGFEAPAERLGEAAVEAARRKRA
jgi:prevent-host-death family protein